MSTPNPVRRALLHVGDVDRLSEFARNLHREKFEIWASEKRIIDLFAEIEIPVHFFKQPLQVVVGAYGLVSLAPSFQLIVVNNDPADSFEVRQSREELKAYAAKHHIVCVSSPDQYWG